MRSHGLKRSDLVPNKAVPQNPGKGLDHIKMWVANDIVSTLRSNRYRLQVKGQLEGF